MRSVAIELIGAARRAGWNAATRYVAGDEGFHRSGKLHDPIDGCRHAIPFAGFDRELTAARRGEAVVLRSPSELRGAPFRLNPSLVLEPMQRRVERALVDLQDVLGNLLYPLRDRPAVHRIALQRPQDQEIECARQQVRNRWS